MGLKVGKSHFLQTLKVNVDGKEVKRLSVNGQNVIKVAKEVIYSSKVSLIFCF